MKLYIKDLEANTKIEELFLITKVTQGITNAGAAYLTITLQDKTGIIEAKLWDAQETDIARAKAGEVIKAFADVIEYRGNLQIRIKKFEVASQDSFNIADFVQTSEISKELLEENIRFYIDSIENSVIHEIITELFERHKQEFLEYPAATRIHHEYVGGLATHVLGMLKLADCLCELHSSINRDLLIAGVILHDFGKLQELSDAVMTEYTTKGKLLGHISIMQAELLVVAKELGYEDKEETTLLRHMILSHHGEYEYGSPVLPLIPEAEYLKFLDNLDARIDMLEKAMDAIEPGEFTPRIFSLENRSFYKPKID